MGVIISKADNGTKSYNYTKVQERLFKPEIVYCQYPEPKSIERSSIKILGYN